MWVFVSNAGVDQTQNERRLNTHKIVVLQIALFVHEFYINLECVYNINFIYKQHTLYTILVLVLVGVVQFVVHFTMHCTSYIQPLPPQHESKYDDCVSFNLYQMSYYFYFFFIFSKHQRASLLRYQFRLTHIILGRMVQPHMTFTLRSMFVKGFSYKVFFFNFVLSKMTPQDENSLSVLTQ